MIINKLVVHTFVTAHMARLGSQRFDRRRATMEKSVPHIVPDYLAHNETSAAIETGREVVRKQFDDLPYNPTKNIARIKLPTNGVYDYARAYFIFEANCTQAGGTYVRFPNGFWNIIHQIRVLDGSEEVFIHRHFNLHQTIQWEIGRQPGVDTTLGASLYGVANAVTRNGWAATHEYLIPFNIPLLTEKVFDYTMLRHALELEITFTQPPELLESDGVTYTWEITNLNIYVEHLKKMNQKYRQSLRGLGGLHFIHNHYDTYTTILNSANLNFTIPHVSESIIGMMVIMRDNTTINDPTVNDKFATYYYNNAETFRIKMNEQYFPEEPLPLTGQCLAGYMQLLLFLDHWEASGEYGDVIPLSSAQWLNNKFIFCYDMEDHPHHPRHYINLREAHPDSNFTLEMRFAAPPGVNQRVDIIIISKCVVVYNKRKGCFKSFK